MLTNLIIVFIGNFIGAIFIAYMLKIAGCLNVESIYTIAYNKINFDFLEAFSSDFISCSDPLFL